MKVDPIPYGLSPLLCRVVDKLFDIGFDVEFK
jgi:hypothetical protein